MELLKEIFKMFYENIKNCMKERSRKNALFIVQVRLNVMPLFWLFCVLMGMELLSNNDVALGSVLC